MITTSRAPRTRRLLIAAFVLSVLIHLFGGALWPRWNQALAKIMQPPRQRERQEEVATSDVVHLERRTVPRPAQASRARPVPQPVRRPVDRPKPRRVAVVTPEPLRSIAPSPKPVPTPTPELVHHAHRAPPLPRAASAPTAPPQPKSKAAMTAAQLAQLNAQFAQTIAASRTDLATIQKRTEEQPVTTRRYPLQFAGLQATLTRGEGYIEPVTPPQRIGGMVYYYTHYTYMWPDGHLEDDDIPWPFRYPVGHDLFAMHIHLIPLQLPPPGFVLRRPLKPFLARFLRAAGAD